MALLNEHIKLFGSVEFKTESYKDKKSKYNYVYDVEMGIKNSYMELSYLGNVLQFDIKDDVTPSEYKYTKGSKAGQTVYLGKADTKQFLFLSGLKF